MKGAVTVDTTRLGVEQRRLDPLQPAQPPLMQGDLPDQFRFKRIVRQKCRLKRLVMGVERCLILDQGQRQVARQASLARIFS